MPTLLSQMAQEVVVITNPCAAIDDNIGITITLEFEYNTFFSNYLILKSENYRQVKMISLTLVRKPYATVLKQVSGHLFRMNVDVF